MKSGAELREWLASEIRDAETSWSVGAFGAIAEFSRDPEEPASLVCDAWRLEAATGRGGVRIDGLENVRAVAYETTNKNPELWSHAIALCLPAGACAMNRRAALAEIGPDAAALRYEDRDARLFDLGLGTIQVDVCVRTADPDLLGALRAGVGKSLFDQASPAMRAILGASPHRVFVTRIGRAEVYQPIPASGRQSPDGPHTRVLSKLLRAGRTHSATNPIPNDWVPCAHLYPAHPAKDAFGRQKPFDQKQHERFQELLGAFGDPKLTGLKRRVAECVEARADPAKLEIPVDRFARAMIRIALRQARALGGSSPNLAKWKQFYDRGAEAPDEEDEQAQHG